MKTSAAVKERAEHRQTHQEFSTLLGSSICGRCAGLLVPDFCTDLFNGTGEFDGAITRCVQCGEVVDPVIQRNRHLQRTRVPNQGGVPCEV